MGRSRHRVNRQVSKRIEGGICRNYLRPMPQLPTAILFDLDDTILSAFGKAPDQWRRVIAAYAEHLEPHPPHEVIEAILAYSRYLWADEMRHKHWRHQIGEARRHIVANAFAELCGR